MTTAPHIDANPNRANPEGDDTDLALLADVKAVLLDHPEWLEDGGALHGLAQAACGNVVDLQAASIRRVERRARMIADTHRRLRAVARANLAVQSQIHAAALSVLDAAGARALDDLLDGPLPSRLGLDRAAVLVEADVPPGLMAIRRAAPGFADAMLGRTRAESLGRIARGRAEIYGDDAADLRSQALLRLSIAGHDGLLALGARDPNVFSEAQGTELVHFLARVIERRLSLWIPA